MHDNSGVGTVAFPSQLKASDVTLRIHLQNLATYNPIQHMNKWNSITFIVDASMNVLFNIGLLFSEV